VSPGTEASARRLKELLWPLERTPLLPDPLLDLAEHLSRHQMRTPGEILATALPARLRSVDLSLDIRYEGFPRTMRLSELATLGVGRLSELAGLWARERAAIRSSGGPEEKVCVPLQDPPWSLRPQATRQIRVMELLWEQGPQPRAALARKLGSGGSQALKGLEEKGLISWCSGGETVHSEDPEEEDLEQYELTPEQRDALQGLQRDLKQGRSGVRLLHGVTGSGKTLVYLHLMRDCLRMGRSCLLLVPEVALALQLWGQVRRRLGGRDTFLYHGYMAAGQKAATFSSAARRERPCAVVGTRSAAFMARGDWGLIVVDEEHDTSFKQEERLVYQAKDVAYYLSQRCGGLLLLGSATPDIKTFHAARNNVFPLYRLTKRVGGGRLPEVEMVDLLREAGSEGPLAGRTETMLQQCLQRGDQAIILLNRRGYAPLVYCTACREAVKCRHCDVGLTYHKKRERLICHYCGESTPFPSPCPGCGGHQFIPISEGTEQVQEYLVSRLDPNVSVLRLDRDTTRRQGSMEEILDRFARRQAQVMVGTQMCSKGHHFPDVTLVAVLDGDVGLNLPDYRSTERTFQLLLQVAGRAGRGDKPGRVLVQTRNPEHYCWHFLQRNDYEGFYLREIELRRKYGYPPFVKLALLRMSYPAEWAEGRQKVQEVASRLRREGRRRDTVVLGPAPAPLAQLKGRVRYQCLLKAATWPQIRAVCAAPLNEGRRGSKLRLHLDLDPVQML
jgi:primosomal protein N' (replication factor Y)